jgi:methylmalonyl-CoA/ethylmalonyl-CoA epimerase
MFTRVHHVGLVVRRLEDGLAFWRDLLGLRVGKQATVKDQGVRAALLPIGRSEIELLEPIDPEGGVAKFLARRGEGLHHVCFETADVAAELAAARSHELPLIDQAPRPGLAGMICFLHPKGTYGVLVEFATPPADESAHPLPVSGPLAGLALREVTASCREPARAAELFAAKLGLAPDIALSEPGVVAAAVQTGDVRLRFVAPAPGTEPAASDGLSALVLEVDDVGIAAGVLAARQPVREADGFRLPPSACLGVPLTFRGAPSAG